MRIKNCISSSASHKVPFSHTTCLLDTLCYNPSIFFFFFSKFSLISMLLRCCEWSHNIGWHELYWLPFHQNLLKHCYSFFMAFLPSQVRLYEFFVGLGHSSTFAIEKIFSYHKNFPLHTCCLTCLLSRYFLTMLWYHFLCKYTI